MKVNSYVHVTSEDGKESAVLAPGDTVPSWATVTNEAAIDGDASASSDETPADEPKRPAPRKPASGK